MLVREPHLSEMVIRSQGNPRESDQESRRASVKVSVVAAADWEADA